MASKAQHLKAILAQRVSWTTADKLLAGQLAAMRASLEKARKEAEAAPLTVLSAAGTAKPNPVHAAVSRMAKEEASLTRRLALGAQRTAGGQYKAASSPGEKRAELWTQWAEDCRANLIPGLWLFQVKQTGCNNPTDEAFALGNPLNMPR